MGLQGSAFGGFRNDARQVLKPAATLGAMVAVAVTPILAVGLLLPGPLVLPAISAGSMTIAAVLSLFAWMAGVRRNAKGITRWDIAGAFLFLGCAAGMLSEPEGVMRLFGLVP